MPPKRKAKRTPKNKPLTLPTSNNPPPSDAPDKSLDDLPPEILSMILNKLDDASLIIANLSCKHWRNVIAATHQIKLVLKEKRNRFDESLVARRLIRMTPKQFLCSTAQEGRLSVLQWAKEAGCPFYSRGRKKKGTYSDDEEEEDDHVAKLRDSQVAVAAARGRERSSDDEEEEKEGTRRQIETLVWLRKEARIPWTGKLPRVAAQRGHLELLQWLTDNDPADGLCRGYPLDHRLFLSAVKGGNVEVLTWLKENGCPVFEPSVERRGKKGDNSGEVADLWLEAAKEGQLQALKWMNDNGLSLSGPKSSSNDDEEEDNDYNTIHRLCKAAASSGSLETLQWLHQQGFPLSVGTFLSVVSDACPDNEAKAVAMLSWLLSNGCPSASEREAIGKGKGKRRRGFDEEEEENVAASFHRAFFACDSVVVLMWAKENGFSLKVKKLFKNAIHNGWLELAQWCAKELAIPPWPAEESPEASTFTWAVEGEKIEVLRWLKEIGCPWSTQTSKRAVERGSYHIEVAQWLWKNGCPWSDQVTLMAAQKGNVTLLSWLMDNGCTIPSKGVYKKAAKDWQRKVLKWAIQKELRPFHPRLLQIAAKRSNYQTLQWLLANPAVAAEGCIVDGPGMYIEAIGERDDPAPFVKLLHKYGVPWDASVPTAAANAEDLNVLKYLVEHGCPWDAETVLAISKEGPSKNDKIYRWVRLYKAPAPKKKVLGK